MNKKMLVREGVILLATCSAFLILGVILWQFGITLWPLLLGCAHVAIALYMLIRLACWAVPKRR